MHDFSRRLVVFATFLCILSLSPVSVSATENDGFLASIWCDVTSWFVDLPSCGEDVASPESVPQRESGQTTSVTIPVDTPPVSVPPPVSTTTTITYVTNPTTIIRETLPTIIREVVKNVSSAVSSGVSADSFSTQVERIYDSLAQTVGALAEAFTTAALTVTGNALISGNLNVSGITATSTITSSATSTATYFAVSTLGAVGAPAFTFTSDLNTGLWSSGADTLNFSTAGAERVRIDSSGNVGIGTTTPSVALSVIGRVQSQAADGSTAFRIIDSDGGSNPISFYRDANKSFTMNVGAASAALTVTNSGNVGIGTTSPWGRLGITGADISTTNALVIANSTNIPRVVVQNGGNVGIGTTSPGALFAVNNTGGFYVLSNGRVGIGVAAPAQQLQISGNFRLPASTATAGIIYSDVNTLVHTFGTNNFFAGVAAGNLTLTGSSNTAVGKNALRDVTIGDTSVAIGSEALRNATSTLRSVAIGHEAMGSANALYSVGIGYYALNVTNDASYNVAIGYQAGIAHTTGDSNTVVGAKTFRFSSTATQNSLFGAFTGEQITTGVGNTVGGYETLLVGTTGNYNTAFGYAAGKALTTGTGNVLYGRSAGDNLTTGTNNIVIGYNIDAPSATSANTLNIGNLIFGTNVDGTGTTLSTGNVGIGTSSPWRKLSVAGTVGFDGLTSSIGTGSLCLDVNKQVVYNASDACLSSTRDTKRDIEPLSFTASTTALDIITALDPVSFIYKQGDGRTRYGFVAEDTAAVDDILATHDEAGALTGIDDRAILAVMVGAVQQIANISGVFRETLVAWLGNMTNGIGDLFVTRVHTQELCVDDVCLDKSEVSALLRLANTPLCEDDVCLDKSEVSTVADIAPADTASTTEDTIDSESEAIIPDASDFPSVDTHTEEEVPVEGITDVTATP